MIQWIFANAIAFMVFGFVAGVMWPIKTWPTLAILGIFVVAFVKFIEYASGNLFRYVIGSKGEFKVWVILNEMYRDGYRVINNLELNDRGDVDHVVVGPTGAWAIESKFRDGDIGFSEDALTRNGKPFQKDPLKQTYAEAMAVREYLASRGFNVPVRPLLVFSRLEARVRFGDTPIKGVYVIGAAYLRKVIGDHRFGKVLEPAQVQKIYDVLEEANG